MPRGYFTPRDRATFKKIIGDPDEHADQARAMSKERERVKQGHLEDIKRNTRTLKPKNPPSFIEQRLATGKKNLAALGNRLSGKAGAASRGATEAAKGLRESTNVVRRKRMTLPEAVAAQESRELDEGRSRANKPKNKYILPVKKDDQLRPRPRPRPKK